MTDDEVREHALRIARGLLDAVEFLTVVEDEHLEDADEDDLRRVHDAIMLLSPCEHEVTI